MAKTDGDKETVLVPGDRAPLTDERFIKLTFGESKGATSP